MAVASFTNYGKSLFSDIRHVSRSAAGRYSTVLEIRQEERKTLKQTKKNPLTDRRDLLWGI